MESDLSKIVCSKKFKYGKNYMIWWWNFSISQKKNLKKKFFCLKSPEMQSKSKKLKEFNIFLKKLKFSPLILKNTLKIFMSQGLDKACLVQRFLAQALNLCSGLLVSSLVSLHLGLKNKSKQREILLLATLWISKMRFTWSKEICYHKAIFSKQFRVE